MSDITLLVGIIGGLLSIVSFFAGQHKTIRQEGQAIGKVFNDVEYIKKNTDIMTRDLRETNRAMVCIDKVVAEHGTVIGSMEKDISSLKTEIKEVKKSIDVVKERISSL